MTFVQWKLSDDIESFDSALAEMKRDLSTRPDGVLIARGPMMSWLAQFYLESLSLSGLVMVDPLQLDDRNGINQFELFYKKQASEAKEFRLFQEYINEWGHWTLQLEPGSVPMLVLSTVQRSAFRRAAQYAAHRHSAKESSVPVLNLMGDNPEETTIKAIDTIADWIDQIVL
jgi:hypothetical protein